MCFCLTDDDDDDYDDDYDDEDDGAVIALVAVSWNWWVKVFVGRRHPDKARDKRGD